MIEPLKKCPECGGSLKLVEYNGARLQECNSCAYIIDLNTGEVNHIQQDQFVVVRCPSCDGFINLDADYMAYEEPALDCPYCQTTFTPPDTVDKTIETVETCPLCGKKVVVPANQGNLEVTCCYCNGEFPFYSGEPELLYEKQNVCPECGGDMISIKRDGITVKECTNCDYAVNTETGEVFHYALEEKFIIEPCAHCHANIVVNADIRNNSSAKIHCPFCGTVSDYPQLVNSKLVLTNYCPHCGKETQVPANKGTVNLTCDHCGEKFDYYSGETKILRSKKSNKDTTATTKDTQSAEQVEEKGFFASIMDMIQQHKEEAEQEAVDILESDLTLCLKAALRKALIEREINPTMRKFRAYRLYVHAGSLSLYGVELRGEAKVEGDHQVFYIDYDAMPTKTKKVRHRIAKKVLKEELLCSVHGLNDCYWVKLQDSLIWKFIP